MPDFHRIRSSLCRTKASQCPPIPQSINQVQIGGAFAETYLGERYLLHLDNIEGVAIFITDTELALIGASRMLYVDGTFRTAPGPYVQIFTIHGECLGRVVNLGAALLTGKTQRHYDVVFTTIAAEVQRVTGVALGAQLIVCDFELAIFNSVRTHFPNVVIGGCYFHFTQNLWRHIQQLGLAGPYQANPNLMQCIRCCFALGLLPPASVVNSFIILENSAATQLLLATYPNLRVFFDYVYNTYIIGGNYPLDTWNVFNRGMSVRTNNVVESYHSRWNQCVGVRHPSLWTFITKLQDQEVITRNSIIQANNGHPPPPRKAKWRRMERRIDNLKTELVNGQRTLAEYWIALTHVIAIFR